MRDGQTVFRLLKKSEIIRALNISGKEFERRLDEGHFPPPIVWITATPRGRRWHPTDVAECFGIDIPQ